MSSPTDLAAQPGPAPTPSFRNLPAVVFFPGDEPAQNAIAGLQRYLRIPFQDFAKGRDSETVLISSLERMIAEKAPVLRAPNVRVIAISAERYHDPRLDGVVYTYLPPNTQTSLLERAIDNAVDHIHLLATRRDVNERLAGATREIRELSAAGAAFCAEHDSEKLLPMILSTSRQISHADAGFLYLLEDGGASNQKGGKLLRLKVAQNDSVAVAFRETVVEINTNSIPGYVAATGAPVNLEDAYHLPEELPFQFDRAPDEKSGYRTKSLLALPLRSQVGELLGVLQLVNAKRDPATTLTSAKTVAAAVVSFTVRTQEMIASLMLPAAVAVENSRSWRAVSRD
jgi:hypothetical protein